MATIKLHHLAPTSQAGHCFMATQLTYSVWISVGPQISIRFQTDQHVYSTDISTVSTPLNPDAWVTMLYSHPDRAFTRYICNDLRTGFRVGFQYGSSLRSASANLLSACMHPEIIADYLRKEVSLGRILGPFE